MDIGTAILGAYLGTLGLLSVYGAHRLQVLWLYWRTRKNAPTPGPVPKAKVTVQLPVFNEPHVVERLVDAACRLDWPKLEIQLLDDSTDETTVLAAARITRWRRKGVDVQLIRRGTREGFKAGALAFGMERAQGDFLAVFDADFLPEPGFLREAMAYFSSEKVGMVQARWTHLNEAANWLTRTSAILLDGHFVLEHTARNRSGRFFNFNGTAGIWRKECIVDAGGWQHDTLTEDLDLSYRAQMKGWDFRYLHAVTVAAELPATMQAFKTQQHRWAKGSIQTAKKLLPSLIRAPLPLFTRVEALAHLSSNLAYPMVVVLALLLPLSVAVRGLGSLQEWLILDLPAFFLASGSVVLFYAVAIKVAYADRRRWWRIPFVLALGIGMSINQTRAVIEGLFGKDLTFVRTPKSGSVGTSLGVVRWRASASVVTALELMMATYYAIVTGWALWSGFWASLPFLLLFGFGFAYVGWTSLYPLFRQAQRGLGLSKEPVGS